VSENDLQTKSKYVKTRFVCFQSDKRQNGPLTVRKAGSLKCEGDIWQFERKWIKEKVFAMQN
jgi:hypothetical protein